MKKNRAPQLPASHRRHFDNSRSARWSERPRTVAFLAGLLVLLFAQAGGRANVGAVEPLPFSKGFLVTGNYVVGGVDLTPQANPACKWLLHRDDPDHRRARRRCEPRCGVSLLRGDPSEPCHFRRRKSNARHQVPRSGDQSGHQRRHETAFEQRRDMLGISGPGLFRSIDVPRERALAHAQAVRLARQVDWKVHRQQRRASRERPAHGDVARKDR